MAISHKPQMYVRSGTHQTPQQACSACPHPNIIQQVIKTTILSKEVLPVNLWTTSCPHILHHKPLLTLLPLPRTYFPPFFSHRLRFPSHWAHAHPYVFFLCESPLWAKPLSPYSLCTLHILLDHFSHAGETISLWVCLLISTLRSGACPYYNTL